MSQPANNEATDGNVSDGIFRGYLSDQSDVGADDDDDDEVWSDDRDRSAAGMTPQAPGISFGIRAPPQPKQRKLDVPAREARKRAYDEQRQRVEKGLQDIEKLIASNMWCLMRAKMGRRHIVLGRFRAVCIWWSKTAEGLSKHQSMPPKAKDLLQVGVDVQCGNGLPGG
jgi:hypothetical protein